VQMKRVNILMSHQCNCSMRKLFIVGSGIKSIAHLSNETIKIIRQSDKVLYLVNENYLKDYLKRESKDSESLDTLYFSFVKRIDAYHAIKDYIIEQCQKNATLCVVFYGHPTMLASSGILTSRALRESSIDVHLLPAISSLDCLFADLQIDPVDKGFFAFDATDFLIHKRKFDIRSHLILLQIGTLGSSSQKKTHNIPVLVNYLLKFYPDNQRVYLYEASQYPSKKARILTIKINELDTVKLKSITTLYIPPYLTSCYDMQMISALGMQVSDFILS
jgi:uncharacterized protein YabN with tetrapyrrole methylase and pyrophosphatase domain